MGEPVFAGASRVERVTVFSEHAHVTRVVEVDVPPGETTFALDDLPPSVDPATLRVTTTAGEVVRVELGLLPDTRPEGAESTADLDVAIEQLTARLYDLTGRAEGLAAELELIDAVVPDKARAPDGALAPARFLEGLDALVERRRETLYQLRMADYERQLTADELDQRKSQRRDRDNPSATLRERTRTMVTLRTDAAVTATLELTYAMGWATWRPFYDLRLTRGLPTIEVTRYAEIWQETGEDWADTNVRTSTAVLEEGLAIHRVRPWVLEHPKPSSGKNRPLPRDASVLEPALLPPPLPQSSPGSNPGRSRSSPDFLDHEAATGDLSISAETLAQSPFAQPLLGPGSDPTSHPRHGSNPRPDSGPRARQFREEGIFSEITAVSAQAEIGPTATQLVEAQRTGRPAPREGTTNIGVVQTPSPDHPDWERFEAEPPPRESSGGFDFELAASERASLPSGHEQHRLLLGRANLPCEVRYLLRPAITGHAFARLTITNSSRVPLLPGNAAVFDNDRYSGAVTLDAAPPKSRVSLDLGAQPRVVARRKSRTSMRTEGLITREDVRVVEVHVEVESHLEEPTLVEVQDQVPISADANVRVRLMKTEPRDARLDDVSGVLTFELHLGPRGRADVMLTYEIESPKDYAISEALHS